MVLDSQVQNPRNRRLNIQLPFEQSTEGSFLGERNHRQVGRAMVVPLLRINCKSTGAFLS